jgi:hypothetical protein
MTEQIKRLEAFFKRKVVDLDKDDGDNYSFEEYSEFNDPKEVEYWSLELKPMIEWTHFVHKFKNSPMALPILHEERLKDVFFESGGIINIHCKWTDSEPYFFTIYVEYAKAPFHLPVFFKSLENKKYETLFKKIKMPEDRKMLKDKDGLPLGIKATVSKIRQLLPSIATMTSFNKHLT